MVWELFTALRRLCIRVFESHPTQDVAEIRQDSALCIILAVQCVEVFFNIYFRVLISEPAFVHAADRISADLQKVQVGIDRKIKEWPELVFGKKLSLDKGVGQKFVALKNLRNSLIHFTSSHETFATKDMAIHGMADTSVYESISTESAIEALHIAEAFLCEVFALGGISSENLPHALHLWTGRPPKC